MPHPPVPFVKTIETICLARRSPNVLLMTFSKCKENKNEAETTVYHVTGLSSGIRATKLL